MPFISHAPFNHGETLTLSRTLLNHALRATLLFGAITPAVHAQDGAPDTAPEAPVELPPPPRFRPVLGLGLTVGGDTLSTVNFSDGTSENVKAGQYVLLYGGFQYQAVPQFTVQATVGFHVDDSTASNAQVKFTRFPFEFLLRYHFNEQWSLGSGMRLVVGAKHSASGDASALPTVNFDNTVGAVIEGEYRSGPNLGWKLRYVSEKYKAQAPFSGTLDGSHMGLLMNWYL